MAEKFRHQGLVNWQVVVQNILNIGASVVPKMYFGFNSKFSIEYQTFPGFKWLCFTPLCASSKYKKKGKVKNFQINQVQKENQT